MKDGIRILGVDDSAFSFKEDEAVITGVVYRGTEFIEEIVFEKVTVDGDDATERLLDLYSKSSNHRQLKAIMVDGLAFAGLNLIDISKVSDKTGKPVVAVTKNRPDREKFVKTVEDSGKDAEIVEKLDDFRETDLKDGKVYFQYSGVELERAEKLLEKSILHGRTPEAIRVADMIGGSMPEL